MEIRMEGKVPGERWTVGACSIGQHLPVDRICDAALMPASNTSDYRDRSRDF